MASSRSAAALTVRREAASQAGVPCVMGEAIRLYTFTLSHFSEKARWALDRAGIRYREIILLPGFHRRRLRRLGARRQVPVLMDGARLIEGSGAILDFADARGSAPPLAPHDPRQLEEVLEWERYLDCEIGEALRRFLYFHLFERPELLVQGWARGGPFWAPALYRLVLPRAVSALKRGLGIDAETGPRDERRVRRAFERLDAHLAGRAFLVGDTFSRADLTLAALSSPLLRPSEHPWRPPAAIEALEPIGNLARELRASLTGQRVAAAYAQRQEPPAPSTPRRGPTGSAREGSHGTLEGGRGEGGAARR